MKRKKLKKTIISLQETATAAEQKLDTAEQAVEAARAKLDKKLKKHSIVLKNLEDRTKKLLDHREDVEASKKTLKGIKMLIAVMVVFTLCYLSIYAWKLYIFFNKINV